MFLIQAWILICSLTAIYFLTSGECLKGSIVGLCGQPAWIISTYTAGQWAIFLLSFVYVGMYIRGIYKHSRKSC